MRTTTRKGRMQGNGEQARGRRARRETAWGWTTNPGDPITFGAELPDARGQVEFLVVAKGDQGVPVVVVADDPMVPVRLLRQWPVLARFRAVATAEPAVVVALATRAADLPVEGVGLTGALSLRDGFVKTVEHHRLHPNGGG